MTPCIGLIEAMLGRLVVSGHAYADSESLTFRRSADGHFLAAIDGYGDGAGRTPAYRACIRPP